MPPGDEPPSEVTYLLSKAPSSQKSADLISPASEIDIEDGTVLSGLLAESQHPLLGISLGERLPYNDYTTIDWLHDLAKDTFRLRALRDRPGLRYRLFSLFDASSGWFAVAIIGILTACVAFMVDVAVATVSDWKSGYCATNYFADKEMCCTEKSLVAIAKSRWNLYNHHRDIGLMGNEETGKTCADWIYWTDNWTRRFVIYVLMALIYGVASGTVTLFTKKNLPATAPRDYDRPFGKAVLDDRFYNSIETASSTDASVNSNIPAVEQPKVKGKVMYMAAGSGIPEIKTVLSGFVIPNLLDFKVLVVKAVGSVFAVSTGMCLGKEGPFVHISTCVAYLVGCFFPKYRNNGRKMRELLSAGCASGLSVAFGAPIGGVLFSYEEISTYFPRRVLWRAFLCSLFAAIALKQLNPTGTGKLVLFETNYGTSYSPIHYLVFVILGIAGGIFGGTFCRANFLWSRSFRTIKVIKKYPVFEVAIVTLVTALLQFPNPATREPGDLVIRKLLIDCKGPETEGAWVCRYEKDGLSAVYVGWLIHGILTKLFLTTITFGIKVPSGIIIPALDAGAFFGRLVGKLITSAEDQDPISPGIFAMVGAVAFLAGVSRMTISLAVIMLELTGELEYVVPYMVGILVAKWVADALEPEGVYDLAQNVLGHPFLDGEQALAIAQKSNALVEELIPPPGTMTEITLDVPVDGFVERRLLEEKLNMLKKRGLMDAGLVLIRHGILQGYLSQAELEAGLSRLEAAEAAEAGPANETIPTQLVRVIDDGGNDPEDGTSLGPFVDRTPMTISAGAPIEFVVEMFSKLGLRYICVLEEGTGRLCGVIIKKRLLDWLHKVKKH